MAYLVTTIVIVQQVIFRTEFLAEFLSVLLLGVGERGGGRALLREEVTLLSIVGL